MHLEVDGAEHVYALHPPAGLVEIYAGDVLTDMTMKKICNVSYVVHGTHPPAIPGAVLPSTGELHASGALHIPEFDRAMPSAQAGRLARMTAPDMLAMGAKIIKASKGDASANHVTARGVLHSVPIWATPSSSREEEQTTFMSNPSNSNESWSFTQGIRSRYEDVQHASY
jgi:hypothetical protein